MDALGPHGLAKLPEELVDLVCSFIVLFSDVQDVITTLGSLALVSRQFLEPARRGLLYDPTRILATRSVEDAHTLLNRVIQQPTLGVQVKRLEGFVDLFDNVEALSLFHDHPPAFMNWAVTLMRLCPNTTAVSVWPDPSAGWLAALASLPRLRHLTIASRDAEMYDEDDLYRFTSFVEALPFARLESLALRGFYGPLSFYPDVVHLPVGQLELESYSDDWATLQLCLNSVRHLTLRPGAFHLDMRTILPPALESFILRPQLSQVQRNTLDRWDACPWDYLFDVPRRFNSLRIVVLDSVVMHDVSFAALCQSAPNLERLELPNVVWHDCWSSSASDSPVVDAIAGLPQLKFLHVGEVAHPPCSILDTRVYCRLFDIELEWRGVELESTEAPRAASHPSEVSDGGLEGSADQDEAMSTGGFGWPEGIGGWGADASSDYEAWSLVRSAELNFDLSFSSSTATSPSSPLLRLLTASSNSSTSLLAPTSHAVPSPRLSPSPTPTLDDDSLSGLVFARTAAAAQRYVAEPASHPHLEDGYQATDDGVDEGLDDEQVWEADECDVSEADREWREFDDEGEDECVGRLWLVEAEWQGEEGDLGSEEP
ncbi:hypothetical protein JCM3775_001977 [Rhodotorula graminis]